MNVISHFRFLKVHQVGLASLFRFHLANGSNVATIPKGFSDPGASLNFGFHGRPVYLPLPAFSEAYLFTRKAAGSSVRKDAAHGATNLFNEGVKD